jgi:hypothetical protein
MIEEILAKMFAEQQLNMLVIRFELTTNDKQLLINME